MRIPAFAAAAAVLVFGLAGCGGITISPTAETPSPVAPTAATTAAPTAAATESPGYGTTGSPTATAGARGGQATADEVGQTFARALGTGNAESACAVMANETSPVASDQAELEQCTSFIQGLMDLVKEQTSALQNATVSGATVSGNTATFANATITPDLAKKLLADRTAVRIDGKWYINS